jgi:hypothetical protein
MDSSQRASRRPAGFDVPQETFENRIEVARRFPERRVPLPSQAVTVPFPQIAIGDGIEVIEIDESIRAIDGALLSLSPLFTIAAPMPRGLKAGWETDCKPTTNVEH